MKVWIVQNANDTIDGVFATEELAKAFAWRSDQVSEHDVTQLPDSTTPLTPPPGPDLPPQSPGSAG